MSFVRFFVLHICICVVLAKLSFGTSSPLVVQVQGSGRERGRTIGAAVAKNIRLAIERNTNLQENLIPYSSTKEGKKVVDSFVNENRAWFPEYMEEIEGMAEGANASLALLYLMNFEPELTRLLDEGGIESCSDVHVGGTANAHNEDERPIFEDISFYVENLDKGWFGFMYPGVLAGWSYGISHEHHMSLSINAVFPKNVKVGGIADVFLCRYLLDATSPADAVGRIAQTLPNIAHGISANVGFHDTSSSTVRIMNVEVSPDRMDVKDIPSGNSYGHFNMFRRLDVPQQDDPSSDHRLDRFNQLGVQNVDSMKKFLGDTNDTMFPVYRRPTTSDPISTLSTGVFDHENQVAFIYHGSNPKDSEPAFTIRF